MIRLWNWIAFGVPAVHHAIRNDGAPARLEGAGCEGRGRETAQDPDGSERCLACLRVVLG